MIWHSRLIRPATALIIVACCLFEFALQYQSNIVHEYESLFLSLQGTLLVCLAAWCGILGLLIFNLKDLPLIGLLLIAVAMYFIDYAASTRTSAAIIFLVGLTLGKGVRLLLRPKAKSEHLEKGGEMQKDNAAFRLQTSDFRLFLFGLVMLLAFSSWWHLDMTKSFYHGPRWMGLWDSPDEYGVLMGAGLVLAVGLFSASRKSEFRNEKSTKVLLIAAGMIGVGLLFSYSRGAWVGTAFGLLYLAKAHGKFKWRFVLPAVFVIATVVFFFWSSTPDTMPWFVKRMDLSRPSAQHRVAAWKAGFEIMRDHPFGVGWNNTVETYDRQYSPPGDSAVAIITNDYLMLGTQLGLPGLLCFVAYVGLCLGVRSWRMRDGCNRTDKFEIRDSEFGIKTACRSGALALLVAFWFDGGLFTLATGAVFWILLELGSISNAKGRMKDVVRW